MTGEFDRITVPDRGKIVEYGDDGFRPSDAPIVPVVRTDADAAVPAARRVLDAAADLTGREVHWLPVPVGGAARERYGDPLPDDAVRALRRFRVGLLGALAADRRTAIEREAELRRRVGLTAAVERRSGLQGVPSPVRGGSGLDLAVFRDVTEDAAAGVEYAPGSPATDRFRDALRETAGDPDRLPSGSAGYGVRPISEGATESLVDAAMGYALDRDRATLTIVHQADLLPDSEGSFLEWAAGYLADEYGEATIDERRFREEFGGEFPDDEVVVRHRRTDEVCRELLSAPGAYDVLVAPAMGGAYVSAVAAEAAGGVGVAPEATIGEGRVVAGSGRPTEGRATPEDANPIGTILSGSLLFEYVGWDDAAATVRTAISATLADGIAPHGLHRRRGRGTPVSADDFADAVVERLTDPDRDPGAGGVPTTPEERTAIRRTIAGLYNLVFEDAVSPGDVELNQLLGEDEEADVYLPEVGINLYYWRRWPAERRIEVLLHELAHVEEEPGERDHGDEFYDRLVELTEIATDRTSELEALFGTSIDVGRVYRNVVESVHEDTIEPDLESVRDRRAALRERFGLSDDDHY